MTKLTGNWYTDPMGEFYSWQDYERLYAEQEQSNVSNVSQNQIPKITEEDCKKCKCLEILTDVDDEHIYRCQVVNHFRTSDVKYIAEYVNSNSIKCR